MKYINTTKATEKAEHPKPAAGFIAPNINISMIKLNTFMCPARILAKSRIISTKGLIIILEENSINGIRGIGNFNHQGTPGVFTI
jgi:hypothetical protein